MLEVVGGGVGSSDLVMGGISILPGLSGVCVSVGGVVLVMTVVTVVTAVTVSGMRALVAVSAFMVSLTMFTPVLFCKSAAASFSFGLGVLGSLSPSSARTLQWRKPKKGKRGHDGERTLGNTRAAKVASAGNVEALRVKPCHLAVRF